MSDEKLVPQHEFEMAPISEEDLELARRMHEETVQKYLEFDALDPETQKELALDSEKFSFPIGFRRARSEPDRADDGPDLGR